MFLRSSTREIWIELQFFGDFRSAVGSFRFSSFGRITNKFASGAPTDSQKCRFVLSARLSTAVYDKRTEIAVYVFSDTRLFGVSVTRRRFICSITSPAIILSRSCSCLGISRGFASRILSVPIGKPLGPRKGTPA